MENNDRIQCVQVETSHRKPTNWCEPVSLIYISTLVLFFMNALHCSIWPQRCVFTVVSNFNTFPPFSVPLHMEASLCFNS